MNLVVVIPGSGRSRSRCGICYAFLRVDLCTVLPQAANQAGRADSVMVLGGMGIRTLSMSPKLISSTKELLSRFSIKELEAISAKHLNELSLIVEK